MSELQTPIETTEIITPSKPVEAEAEAVENLPDAQNKNEDENENDQTEQSFDELMSLEREIAEMHHGEPTFSVPDECIHDGDEEKPAAKQESLIPGHDENLLGNKSGCVENVVEHEDLIAVLKGIDQLTPEKATLPENTSASPANDNELADGVTIEGEGQFQIMEIVDDEDEPPAAVKLEQDPLLENPSVSKAYVSTKMTKEEERAMAMEQIEGLKLHVTERQRRRKQERTELASKLGDEWSDDEPTIEPTLTVPAASTAKVNNASGDAVAPKPKVTSVVQNKEIAERKVTEPDANAHQITGFKRTRVIKRKIIWDPDAPETQISYAQLVRSTGKSNTQAASAKAAQNANVSPTLTATKPTTTIKKEPAVKKVRPNTQKDKKLAENIESKKTERATTPFKAVIIKVEDPDVRVSSPVKRRSQTPVSNGAGGSKKKKISEIDRLMGDEGAINMLNSLESERGRGEVVETDTKPHRLLMRSRATTVSEKSNNVAVVATKKESPSTTKTKRATKQKPSTDWDYVYKQKASEDAMIIRRRSNSSYSSSASIHRLSIDGPAAPKANAETAVPTKDEIEPTTKSLLKVMSKTQHTNDSAKQNAPTSTSKTFEFAKPESKSKSNQKQNRRTKSPLQGATSQLTNDMKNDATSTNKRGARSPVDEKEKHVKPSTMAAAAAAAVSPVSNNIASEVVVKKSANVAQIIFNTDKSRMEYTFTTQLMDKLVAILKKLSVDNDCNAVVMLTNAPHFCQGIDLSDLLLGSLEKRKNVAVRLASSVKNYLKAIATFPKPLIAGVSGTNIGLGVTQLALFDVVIASDKSSYETPYAKIGQTPEGFCIWNNMTKIRGNFKTKLFWLCDKLHATESALSGLINKLAAHNKVNEDAISYAKKIAANSAEVYRVMKKTVIHSHLDAIVTGLDEEFDTIISQWSSLESNEAFKKYLESRQQ